MNSGFTEIKFFNHNYQIADISTLANIKKIPYSYRILAENVLRQKYQGQNEFADQQMEYIVNCKVGSPINFVPNRILSHDILGKVMLVDFFILQGSFRKKKYQLTKYSTQNPN